MGTKWPDFWIQVYLTFALRFNTLLSDLAPAPIKRVGVDILILASKSIVGATYGTTA